MENIADKNKEGADPSAEAAEIADFEKEMQTAAADLDALEGPDGTRVVPTEASVMQALEDAFDHGSAKDKARAVVDAAKFEWGNEEKRHKAETTLMKHVSGLCMAAGFVKQA